ncbi:MAG: glutamine-hydrolyzing carbamoyl-phosphate synthase small subunit [Bdellovibrionales bacterium]|nr:glutamine-hydrolyzing carbamoyl-phosphate synthase small subunit [Bdellovibrionales bacterium]
MTEGVFGATQPAGIPAKLVLADGTVFLGLGFGAFSPDSEPIVSEIVFNTSMSGYQEILTDPSYMGQGMCFTAPQIGNVGCNPLDIESEKVYVSSVFTRDLSSIVSNFRAKESLDQYLKRYRIPGLTGVQTRALTLHLRDNGAQMGAIGKASIPDSELQNAAAAQGSMAGKDYVQEVSCKEPYEWFELPWDSASDSYPKVSPEQIWERPHVVVLDCGVKKNILRLLLAEGFRVTVLPARSSADEIRALKPDGIFLSNGPGDPAALPDIIAVVKELLGVVPIFGICLGCQLMAHAAGGKTYKLKFGHRGANHPILQKATGEIEITSQNHGFAVEAETLPSSVQVTHVNQNDHTVAGIALPELKAFAVQYHPEASPGPHDSRYLFKRFFELVVS